MSMTHMCMNIKGWLRNTQSKKPNSDSGFTDEETGKPLTIETAREEMYKYLSEGKKVLPIGKCDNFSYETGCMGHPDSEENK